MGDRVLSGTPGIVTHRCCCPSDPPVRTRHQPPGMWGDIGRGLRRGPPPLWGHTFTHLWEGHARSRGDTRVTPPRPPRGAPTPLAHACDTPGASHPPRRVSPRTLRCVTRSPGAPHACATRAPGPSCVCPPPCPTRVPTRVPTHVVPPRPPPPPRDPPPHAPHVPQVGAGTRELPATQVRGWHPPAAPPEGTGDKGVAPAAPALPPRSWGHPGPSVTPR